MTNRPSSDATDSAASSPATDSSGSFMIDLRIHTSDPRRRELIRRYWRLDDSGSDFAEPFETLKSDFGLSRGGIVGIVRADSTAVSGIHRCSKCGRPKIFDCRKDFRETPKQKPFTCEDCAAVEPQLEAATEGQISTEGPGKKGVSGSEVTSEEKKARGEEGNRAADAEAGAQAGVDVGTGTDSKSDPEMNAANRSLMAAARKLAEASRHLEGLARQAGRSGEEQFS